MSRRIRSFLNQNTNTLVASVEIFVGISVGVSAFLELLCLFAAFS